MIAYLRTGRGVFPVLLTGEERDGLVEISWNGERRFVDPSTVSECAGGRCEIRR